MVVLVEPPRVRKVKPSLRDLANVEDAQWRRLTRFEVAVGRLKWKLKNKLLLALDKLYKSH